MMNDDEQGYYKTRINDNDPLRELAFLGECPTRLPIPSHPPSRTTFTGTGKRPTSTLRVGQLIDLSEVLLVNHAYHILPSLFILNA